MLRDQIPEQAATYPQPDRGVNLRTNPHDLRAGEAALMQNCEHFGALRIRRGSQRLTPASLGAFTGRGGHKFYYGGANPQSARLIAYNNKISAISGTGVETSLTSSMTANQHTYFATWPITQKVYISNATNALCSYDGTTFETVSGSNIPAARTAVVPVSDRLLAITTNGIERSDPRSDSVWSNNSSWATLRPQRPGLFTAMHPFALQGLDAVYEGAIALQERAYYHITGSDFGTSVVAASASVDEDVSIKLLDPTVGTGSPDSLCTVPGVGVFWFTTDLNVFWLPQGSLVGQYVGTKLQSTGAIAGLESANSGQLKAVWMTYFDHYLMLSIPTGTSTYATTQWWMDMRQLRNPLPGRDGIVWYGPMTGQSIGKAWVENQEGDNAIYGVEGNSATGLFVYQLRVPGRFTDAVGTNDIAYEMVYQSYFKDFGAPTRSKYIQAVHMDLNSFSGTATLDLVDLAGDIITNVPIDAVS